MGNLKNRVDVRLVSNKKDYLKWTSKPSYVLKKIFHSDLVAVRKIKTTLTLNKPTHVGICVLELSKVSVYEFRYDYIKNKYDNKSRLLFTDRYSSVYEIETKNVYDDFNQNKEMSDFSNRSVL